MSSWGFNQAQARFDNSTPEDRFTADDDDDERDHEQEWEDRQLELAERREQW